MRKGHKMMNKTNNQQTHLKAEKVVDWGHEGGNEVMIYAYAHVK